MEQAVSAVVLAGGGSRRMGFDKRRLRLWGSDGPTLLERTVERAARYSDDVLVALGDPQAWPGLGARLIADRPPGGGPLAGLAAGLAAMRYEYGLVLACDTPLLQDALLAALIAHPRPFDALVPLRPSEHAGPRNRERAEPLLALYRRGCLAAVEQCLARGETALVAPLAQLDVRWLPPEVWRRHDPDGLSFRNLNRPDDVEEVRELLRSHAPPEGDDG